MSSQSLFRLLLTALILTLNAGICFSDEMTAKSSDGVPVHYVAEGSGGTGLVFVHGWCCDAGYWQDQMDEFSSRYRVLAVDLAGHGKSGVDRQEWTMAAFAADVKAVVDKEGLDDVVLIGHSMGGAVIAEAALLMPERVRGLVGVDNFQNLSLGLSDEQIAGLIGHFGADFSANVKPWVQQMFLPDADAALGEKISSDMASAPPEVGLGAMGSLLNWYNTQPASVLPRLPAPLHCINSDRAPTNEAALTEACPDYSLRLMKGGHFLAQEDPATFNRLLNETLADLLDTEG